jgi:hypothetical protein
MKSKLVFVLVFIFLFCGTAFAKKNVVYRTFYVPYMPGAERPYGAYRIIAHTGDYNVSIVKGALDYSTGKISNNREVVDVFQTADLIRSDLIILTNKTGINVTDVKHSGNTTYYDTIYYETPEYVIGYFVDFSPLVGSLIMEGQGRPYFVASKISSLKSLFPGATEQDILKSLINYQGANPQGKKIPLGGERYVISQKPDQVIFNWWMELSQEFLSDSINLIKDLGDINWQGMDEYHVESTYKNGIIKSLPVLSVSFSDFPTMLEMMELWESKRGILGKSALPEKFTDYMTMVSPGTWISPNATFTSCDPDFLIRWLYDIPQKKGQPKVQVSTRISTDFSNFMVDKELYDKLMFSDPNILFAFAPFDEKIFDTKSGVKIFFPYQEKYRDERNISESFGETGKVLPRKNKLSPEAWKEFNKNMQEAGVGKFSGNVESRYYSVAACYFQPTDENSATNMLKSAGFEKVLKALGVIP